MKGELSYFTTEYSLFHITYCSCILAYLHNAQTFNVINFSSISSLHSHRSFLEIHNITSVKKEEICYYIYHNLCFFLNVQRIPFLLNTL